MSEKKHLPDDYGKTRPVGSGIVRLGAVGHAVVDLGWSYEEALARLQVVGFEYGYLVRPHSPTGLTVFAHGGQFDLVYSDGILNRVVQRVEGSHVKNLWELAPEDEASSTAELTCNGVLIPEQIRTCRIISAFENVIEAERVVRYRELILSSQGLPQHEIPPITGYPDIVDAVHVESELMYMDGSPVSNEHIGQVFWFVTDGHHRSLAAIEASLPMLNTTMDLTCFTRHDELLAWREANSPRSRSPVRRGVNQ